MTKKKKNTPITNLKVTKTKDGDNDKKNSKTTQLDELAIKQATEALEKLGSQLEGKQYSITNERSVKTNILEFVKTDVKWKGLECAGVNELYTRILDQEKSTKLELDGTAVHALFWFLKEHVSQGLKEAQKFVEMIIPVSEAMTRMQNDKKEFETLQFKLASLEQGIDEPDTEE